MRLRRIVPTLILLCVVSVAPTSRPNFSDSASKPEVLRPQAARDQASMGQIFLTVTVMNLAVSVTDEETLPRDFALIQNYPNPFNSGTVIEYYLPIDCLVNVSIYNILGQKVAVLVDSRQRAGRRIATWNSTDFRGRPVASGIYFYLMRAEDYIAVKKMMVLR
jgi:hypothetical protein